jgi:hypothetical protein
MKAHGLDFVGACKINRSNFTLSILLKRQVTILSAAGSKCVRNFGRQCRAVQDNENNAGQCNTDAGKCIIMQDMILQVNVGHCRTVQNTLCS